MGQCQLIISAPKVIVSVHSPITQQIDTQSIEEGETTNWSIHKIRKSHKGKIATKISYADNRGGTKEAAYVSLGS